uniref:Uncharacterized protein n=1 Tax=Solanum lycopersicum TaxID=4081 RepID=A0A3Q7J617_SOLLC
MGYYMASGLGDMVVDTEIRTFSAALFDEYGGLVHFSNLLSALLFCITTVDWNCNLFQS